jgi:hypothetical protein
MTATTVASTKHQPRHARPPAYRRAATYVSVRLPRPIVAAWDAAEQRPWLTAAAVPLAAASVAAVWHPEVLLVAVVGVLGAMVGGTARLYELRTSREREGRLDAENAALKARLRLLEAGEASAQTAQIRPIGDFGERTS